MRPNQIIGGYWESTQNRKDFFVSFAEEHQFDPLVPNNWYNVREFKELEEGVCISSFLL